MRQDSSVWHFLVDICAVTLQSWVDTCSEGNLSLPAVEPIGESTRLTEGV